MKKVLLLMPLLLGIIIFSGVVKASSGTCSVESSEYDHCWYNTYGTATVYIQVSDPYDADGYKNLNGGLYLDYAKMNVKCFPSYGGKLYKYVGLDTWGEVSCDEHGCNGELMSSNTVTDKIASVGDSHPSCVTYVCWYNNGDYWVWGGYGWVGNNCHFNFEVVECKSDSDCSGNYICDDNQCVESQPFTECEQYGIPITINCPECNLASGNNYFKYTGNSGSVSDVISPIASNVDTVWYYDGNNWYVYSTSGGSNTLSTLDTNKCYTIKTNSAVNWSLTTTTTTVSTTTTTILPPLPPDNPIEVFFQMIRDFIKSIFDWVIQ